MMKKSSTFAALFMVIRWPRATLDERESGENPEQYLLL